MANPTINTGYSGEVLEALLTIAITGNEIVQGGHIKIQSDVKDKFTLPRLQLGEVVQPRKETPVIGTDSKGDFTIDEKYLEPQDAMVYVEFNPREFEEFWRPFQPKGNLVFRELPPEVQVAMVGEILKQVNSWMGRNIWQGNKSGATPDNLFDGLITKAVASSETIIIPSPVVLTQANIIEKIGAVYAATPIEERRKSNFKIFTSVTTCDLYEDAILAQTYKGNDVTGVARKTFKNIPIVPLVGFPDDAIFGAVGDTSRGSNIWMGVDVASDGEVVQVEKVQANSEKYFFKMLFKTDTNIVWNQRTVLYKV